MRTLESIDKELNAMWHYYTELEGLFTEAAEACRGWGGSCDDGIMVLYHGDWKTEEDLASLQEYINELAEQKDAATANALAALTLTS